MRSAETESFYTQGRTILAMWAAIAAAPLAWALHLNVAYLLAALVCTPALAVWLYGFTALMLALAGGGAVACWRWHRRTRGAAANGERAMARTHFLVGAGLLGSILFMLAIAAQTVPVLFYAPC